MSIYSIEKWGYAEELNDWKRRIPSSVFYALYPTVSIMYFADTGNSEVMLMRNYNGVGSLNIRDTQGCATVKNYKRVTV